ncbi:MAG: PLP-dependent aminotransferase family protein [Dongiaceae bacterium]
MTIWRPNLAGKSGPTYKLIAQAIGESIADGSLTERDRLPTQRDLAYRLGISLNTVSRAYAEAIRRGFLYGEVGRGTYVRTGGPLPAPASQARMIRPKDGPIDFALNLPAAGESAAALAETLGSLKGSAALASYLDYQTDGDLGRHAEAAAAWIRQLGLDASGDDVVLTNGAQHGLMVAMLAVMRPGDVLLTESMTYAPIKAMAQHLGLKLFPVAMDEGGLSPDGLDAACRTTAAKTLYCLPTLHTPTTITMTAERRRDIAEIARRHELLIIEDDVFGYLPIDRPPPLACFAPERVLFVTSVSKSLAPGLRVGYLHVPSRFYRSVRAVVNLSCWMPPPLMAEIASIWINEGTAHRLNDFQRSEAQTRQLMAQRILGAYAPRADPFGFHLWLPLPAHWRAEAFRVAAERQGVKVLTGETFAVERADAPHAIRLCLSHETTRERVARGLEIVARLLSEPGDPGVLVV